MEIERLFWVFFFKKNFAFKTCLFSMEKWFHHPIVVEPTTFFLFAKGSMVFCSKNKKKKLLTNNLHILVLNTVLLSLQLFRRPIKIHIYNRLFVKNKKRNLVKLTLVLPTWMDNLQMYKILSLFRTAY